MEQTKHERRRGKRSAQLSGRTASTERDRQGTTQFKYFLDETDELIQLKDYPEIEIANRRAEKIVSKISDLISQAERLKIDHGVSARSVRQWKKDVKARYSTFIADKERHRQEEIDEEMERKRFKQQEK